MLRSDIEQYWAQLILILHRNILLVILMNPVGFIETPNVDNILYRMIDTVVWLFEVNEIFLDVNIVFASFRQHLLYWELSNSTAFCFLLNNRSNSGSLSLPLRSGVAQFCSVKGLICMRSHHPAYRAVFSDCATNVINIPIPNLCIRTSEINSSSSLTMNISLMNGRRIIARRSSF